MKQRLLSISILSSSLVTASLLLNACSTWGANPPPRYNEVIGDRRAPVLNPGGSGVVRPADEIAPPIGIYARPLNQQNPQQPSTHTQPSTQDSLAPFAPAPATRFDQSMNTGAPVPTSQIAQRAVPIQNNLQPTLAVESTPLSATNTQNISATPVASPFGIGSDPLARHPAQAVAIAQNNPFSNLAPAAGRNAPSIAVSPAPTVIADIGAMRTGEDSNSNSAAWQNLPGANPLTPELSAEEKLEAQAESAFANLAPAAGNSTALATPLALTGPTPTQIENAQAVLAQISRASTQRKLAKKELKNSAINLFSEAKNEEKSDAILAVARDTRNPINSTSQEDSSAFTYTTASTTDTTPARAPVARN